MLIIYHFLVHNKVVDGKITFSSDKRSCDFMISYHFGFSCQTFKIKRDFPENKEIRQANCESAYLQKLNDIISSGLKRSYADNLFSITCTFSKWPKSKSLKWQNFKKKRNQNFLQICTSISKVSLPTKFQGSQCSCFRGLALTSKIQD